jgi:sialic acid synthase SpsE
VPDELTAMIARLHDVAASLGDGIKRPAFGEANTARLVRRSWHTRHALPAGSVLGEKDIVLKRPADGLPPSRSPVGCGLNRALEADTPLSDGDLTPATTVSQ